MERIKTYRHLAASRERQADDLDAVIGVLNGVAVSLILWELLALVLLLAF